MRRWKIRGGHGGGPAGAPVEREGFAAGRAREEGAGSWRRCGRGNGGGGFSCKCSFGGGGEDEEEDQGRVPAGVPFVEGGFPVRMALVEGQEEEEWRGRGNSSGYGGRVGGFGCTCGSS